MAILAFPHRERKDICGTIAGKVFEIEVRYLIIVDQQDTQFTLVTPQVA